MSYGKINVFAPSRSDTAQISFTERQWELAKATLDEGEDLWDYPVEELDYLCDPENGHCGEEFLLVGGRLHQLEGLTYLAEFYGKDEDELQESDLFGSLAEALEWCKTKAATDPAAMCYVFVSGSKEDPDPIATVWNPARYKH